MRYLILPIAAACLLAACGSKSSSSSSMTPSPAAATQSTAAPSSNARPDVAPTAQGGRTVVSGTIQAVSGAQVNLTDGTSFDVSPAARIVRQQAESAGELKKGDYVAITGKRQPDNSVLASMVSVFPASLGSQVRGGQRPEPDGNLMTNATIDTISGKMFAVAWDGGGAQITLASDARIIKQTDATPADLKAGEKITASVANGVAQSLTIQ